MKNIFGLLLCFCLSNSYQVHAQQEVKYSEYQKEFTSYPFSDPDPIPSFSKIYPYFRFDGFTETAVQKNWKVVEIENEYIKILILPEVGGKIWAAIDKKINQPFIYYNHTVKFRDVAMRGPWTSGGIEANYGIIGHTPNCATPVDYIVTKKADGSVSCTIGVLDLLTQTNWRMEINVPKDKAYFTTQSFWYNNTPTEQPYYHWMNVGLKVSGNLEYIYPGTKYIGHEGEYNDWPINKENGKNISFYNNNNFGTYKSYHVFGKYTNFFGTYWHDDDYGMVRYGNHDDKAGKKIWIWGLSRQGMIWEKYLTDTDQQYTEVQSGRLFNQNAERSTVTPFKHVNFAPYSTDTWKEYWYAVNKTKGMVEASVYGALNMVQQDGWLKVMFCPVQQINDALEIKVGDKIIYSKQLSLAPTINFTDSVKYNESEGSYSVSIGGVKLNYSSAPESNVLSRPVESPSTVNWKTAEGLYVQGKEYMDQKLYAQAEDMLAASLKLDSNYLPALVKMSSLLYHNHEYQKALLMAKRALSIDTHDGSANYYYGIINAALGNVVDAKDGFDLATLSAEYKTGAYTELAKLYLAEKNYHNVIEYTQKALTFNAINIAALQLQAIAYRYTSDIANHEKTLSTIKQYDVLNHFANFEAFYSASKNNGVSENQKNSLLASFTNLIRNEQPVETYLQLANDYFQVGLLDEAEKVLTLCPANTLAKYWLAFIHYTQHKNYQLDLEQANGSVPDFVFPYRNIDFDVFEWATKQSSHWAPKYYLGLLFKDRNKIAEAKEIFKSLKSVPTYAPFYAARANLFMSEISTPSVLTSTVADLTMAISMDKNQWRYIKTLTELYNSRYEFSKALETVELFYKNHTGNYIMGMLYAKTLMHNKEYVKADQLLATLNIIPFEGATSGHELYREAKLMQAIVQMKQKNYSQALTLINEAKLWPENLGAGKPYDEDIDIRLENWLSYLCYKNSNNKEAASEMLGAVVKFMPIRVNTISNFYAGNHLISLWAYAALNQVPNGMEWIKQQQLKYPDNKIIQWVVGSYQKKTLQSIALQYEDATVRIIKELNAAFIK